MIRNAQGIRVVIRLEIDAVLDRHPVGDIGLRLVLLPPDPRRPRQDVDIGPEPGHFRDDHGADAVEAHDRPDLFLIAARQRQLLRLFDGDRDGIFLELDQEVGKLVPEGPISSGDMIVRPESLETTLPG